MKCLKAALALYRSYVPRLRQRMVRPDHRRRRPSQWHVGREGTSISPRVFRFLIGVARDSKVPMRGKP